MLRRALALAIALVAVTAAPSAAKGKPSTTTTSSTSTTSTSSTSSTTTTSTTSTTVKRTTTTTAAKAAKRTTSTVSTSEGTFSILAETLGISVPSSANLGTQSGASGNTFSASLGTVTVDDSRTGTLRTWTATVSSTSFTSGAGGAQGTIPTSSVKYWSGGATGVSGTIVATPGQLTSVNAQTLSASRTTFSSTGGSGTTSVSWNPTIVVIVPSGVFGGTYTGTITHSVA